MADSGYGLGIFGGVPGQDIEQQSGIGDIAGMGTDHVTGRACQWRDPGIGNQAKGRFDRHQALRRGGVLDRAAGLFGQASYGKAGCNGSRCTTGASSRGYVAINRIIGWAIPTAIGSGTVAAEGRNIGFAEHDGTSIDQASHNGSVVLGNKINAARGTGELRPASGGRQTGKIHRFLDDDRNTSQRAKFFACCTAFVDSACLLQSVGIHEGKRVVIRFILLDPCQGGGG